MERMTCGMGKVGGKFPPLLINTGDEKKREQSEGKEKIEKVKKEKGIGANKSMGG